MRDDEGVGFGEGLELEEAEGGVGKAALGGVDVHERDALVEGVEGGLPCGDRAVPVVVVVVGGGGLGGGGWGLGAVVASSAAEDGREERGEHWFVSGARARRQVTG